MRYLQNGLVLPFHSSRSFNSATSPSPRPSSTPLTHLSSPRRQPATATLPSPTGSSSRDLPLQAYHRTSVSRRSISFSNLASRKCRTSPTPHGATPISSLPTSSTSFLLSQEWSGSETCPSPFGVVENGIASATLLLRLGLAPTPALRRILGSPRFRTPPRRWPKRSEEHTSEL